MKTNLKTFNWILFNLIIFNLINLQSADAQMFWNQACQFAGNSSSYITVRNSTTTNITGSFTLEAWINRSGTGTQGIIAKGGVLGTSLRYGMRFENNRIQLVTNGIQQLTTKPSTSIPLNQWTHVAGTYNSATNQFRLYVNGVLDSSRTVAGAAPLTNTDTLFIGICSASAPFQGQMDDVRLWNRELSSAEVGLYFRTMLGANTGIYSGLVMSLTFQNVQAVINTLHLTDKTGNGNNAINKGASVVNQADRPYLTIVQNESVELDGTDDYLAAPDDSTISPTGNITLRAWVYLRNLNPVTFISKGSNYRLGYNGVQITFGINSNFFSTGVNLPVNQWTHLALTYASTTGIYSFYLNGILRSSDTIGLGSIVDGADSLLIGGGPAFGDLNGFIDEIEISHASKSQWLINSYVYQSMEASNDPFPTVVYNLDGIVNSGSMVAPRLSFRNNARFSHPGTIENQPVSPQNRNDNSNFSESYYLTTSNKRIPSSGTSGTISDSTIVNLNTTITDVNLFVALNHTNSTNLDITLVGPNNDSVKVFDSKSTLSLDENVITIFNDQADSALLNNRYTTFSPVIRPENNLNSVFGGDNSQGRWKLIIRDESSNDTGFLYAWGIQFNNLTLRARDLNLTSLIQGFYNSSTNLMIPDTMRVYLRNGTTFSIIDSSRVLISNTGSGLFSFSSFSVISNQQYYFQLKHRNSIETWSNTFSFINDEAVYSIVNAANAVFGSNQIQVDNSPIRFAIYGGDVNRDGVVDATDAGAIDNDAFNFVTGYVATDVTGDDIIDASDAAIVDNNAANFVVAVLP